jgi:Fe-S cluster assembly protein SufD
MGSDRVAGFDALRERLGPGAFGPEREAAFARFAELGFPTTRHEDWKYTNIRSISGGEFVAAPPAKVAATDLDAVSMVPDSAARIVFVNGRLEAGLSRFDSLPEGLSIESLRQSPAKDSAEGVNRTFAALNAAFHEDGVRIQLARGRSIELPIELILLTETGQDDVEIHPRILIQLEEGSELQVVETHGTPVATEARCFVNDLIDIELGTAAILDHVRVLNRSDQALRVGLLQVRQQRDSSYRNVTVSLGSDLFRQDTDVDLQGSGAECSLAGLSLGGASQHADHQVLVRHSEPHCSSHQTFKALLAGKARSVFTGRVIVAEGAQGTAATQQSRNILLSDGARADARPQLEIFADDVVCSHGATVGRLDETALFYLRSRGIPKVDARRLLCEAFGAEIVDGLRVAAVKDRLVEMISGRLSELVASGDAS